MGLLLDMTHLDLSSSGDLTRQQGAGQLTCVRGVRQQDSLRASLTLWVFPAVSPSGELDFPHGSSGLPKHERRSYQAQNQHSAASIMLHCRTERQTQISEKGKEASPQEK